MAFNVSVHRYTTLAMLIGLNQWNPWILFGAWLGSALPDTDTPHSGIGKVLPLWLITGRNGHRKYTHSLLFACVLGAITALINIDFGIGVLIGTLMHLFGDMTTRVGLPYGMWPFKYNPKHPYFTGEMFKEEKIEAAD